MSTGGKVETRIANAENEATYLLAKVEVVSTYKLAGINRSKMEKLFHRLFSPARLNITINDRFGHPVQPEEWFLCRYSSSMRQWSGFGMGRLPNTPMIQRRESL